MVVPSPRRLTDLLESEANGVQPKQGPLFTGRTRRVVRRGMHARSNPFLQTALPSPACHACPAAVLGYIWPSGDWKGKVLICVSMVALCLAKWLNILVPFALKRAVDALEAQQQVT